MGASPSTVVYAASGTSRIGVVGGLLGTVNVIRSIGINAGECCRELLLLSSPDSSRADIIEAREFIEVHESTAEISLRYDAFVLPANDRQAVRNGGS